MTKKVFKRLMVTVLTLAMLIANMQATNGMVAKAATSSKSLAEQYLNATNKYLHLGTKTQNTFDFNIKSSAIEKKAKYVWTVDKKKGNPDSVSINSKTGVVTAKKVGTAYIYCKITNSKGSVIKPETSVTVRNNAKEISISEVSNYQIVAVGSELKFGYQVANTEAGAKIATSDIIRWDIQEDKAGTTVSSKGVTKSSKEGTFQIRAVCFQSSSKYSAWLNNKAANEKYITASSQWYTIFVEKNLKEAVVTNQTELEAALNDKNITLISIQTKEAINFNIPKGDYSDKSITVIAPNGDVNNKGTFKHIVIQEIKDTTWNEYASNNSIYLNDSLARLVIDNMATLNEIVVSCCNSNINIVANGSINIVSLSQPAQVSFTGTSNRVPVAVERTAAGSTISSSIPLNLNMMANTAVNLSKGAEGTVLNRADNTVGVNVTNDTQKEVQLLTNNVVDQVVAPTHPTGTPAGPTGSTGPGGSTPIPVKKPIAKPDSADVLSTEYVDIPILNNDVPEGYTSITVVQPENGTAVAEDKNGDKVCEIICYTPKSNFEGVDKFTYYLTNSAGNSNVAEVTINVTYNLPILVNKSVDASCGYDYKLNILEFDELDENETYSVSLEPYDKNFFTVTGSIAEGPISDIVKGNKIEINIKVISDAPNDIRKEIQYKLTDSKNHYKIGKITVCLYPLIKEFKVKAYLGSNNYINDYMLSINNIGNYKFTVDSLNQENIKLYLCNNDGGHTINDNTDFNTTATLDHNFDGNGIYWLRIETPNPSTTDEYTIKMQYMGN